MSSQPKFNPFPGLRPFEIEEDYLFFGREEQVAELLGLLREHRFLAVVGTSGSGKSSLVRAGLLPALHGGTMTHAGSSWEVLLLRPGAEPIANLAGKLIQADLYDAEDEESLPRVKATLTRSRLGLVEAVKQSDLPQQTNLLVVVDQFEELFRFHESGESGKSEAATFVRLLLAAAQQQEQPIYVTITMRSDYLGDCAQIPGLAEAVNDGEYLIPRLSRKQRRAAIEKPVHVGGGKIATTLVHKLLNEVGDDADQLPVLQHALMRMWEAWLASGDTERPIDFCDFEATGGLTSALSNHADEIYDSLPSDAHRDACEKIFKTLTEKGEDNRGIRRPTRLSQLQAIAGTDRAGVIAVLDAFRKSGVTFLMPGEEVPLNDRTVVDLSHESLMRCWQRLRMWVDDEAQSARIFRRLADTAVLWSEKKAGLFRDPDLQIAVSWREQQRPNFEWAEQYGGQFETALSFLEKSNAVAEAEEQAREAARQHELEQAQQLSEAQQLRLEQQQRSARKLRKMMTGLAAVAVVAGIAFVAALVANNQANKLRIVASQEAENARQSEDRAKKNADKAEQSAVEANRLSEAAQLAERAMEKTAQQAEADRIVAQRESYRSTVKLAESMLQGNEDTRFRVADVLWQTQPELRSWEWGYLMAQCPLEEWGLQTDVTGLSSAVATVDGRFLVTAGIGGTVALWDLESRRQLWQQAAGRVHELAVDAQGRFVAVSYPDAALPQLKILELATGNLVHQSDRTGIVECVFSARGEELYVLEQGTVRCISTSTWEQRAQAGLKGLFADGHPKYNALFVDEAGKYVGVCNQYGTAGQPMFSFFDAQTLGSTTQLAGFHELAKNVGSPSTPILNTALGELTYSFTTSVYRKTIDGERRLLCDFPDYVKYLTVDSASGTLLAATAKGGVQIVDVDGGTHSVFHGAPITGLATLPQGRFVTAGADGLIKCWTLTPPGKLAAKTAAPVFGTASANFLQFAGDGHSLLYRTWDRHNALYQLDSLSYRHFLYPDRGGNRDLFPMIRPTTNELVDSSENGLLFFPPDSEGTDRESVRTIPVSRPISAAFDSEGRILVVSSADGNLAVFDLESNEPVPAPDVKESGPVAINSSGTRAALQTKEQLLVWEVATGRLLNRLDVARYLDSTIPPPVFHPDGELIAVRANFENPESTDGWDRLVLWNSSLGETYRTIQLQPGVGIYSCRFSADGDRLYVVCSDDKVRILDWRIGEELIVLTGGANLNQLAVSPDELTLAYAGFNPNLFVAKSLPWAGETPRHETFYRAVDDLRLFTATSNSGQDEPTGILGLLGFSSADNESATKEELLGDVAMRQGRQADAMENYSTAIQIRKAVVRKERTMAAPQGKLTVTFQKQLAILAETDPDSCDELLQQTVKFWNTLLQDPATHPAGWKHLLRFQQQLFDYQISNDEVKAKESLMTFLSFWVDQTAKTPDNRVCRYGASVFCQRLANSVPAAAASEAIDRLISDRPEMTVAIAEAYSAVEDFAGAVAVCSKGISKETASSELLSLRARMNEKLQDWSAAANDWQRLAANDPDGGMLLIAFIDRLVDEEQLELAETVRTNTVSLLRQQLQTEQPHPQIVIALANLLLTEAEQANQWTLLKPTEMKSEGGATLTLREDGSILASGKNPDQDAYQITAKIPPQRITAIRLEAIPDASLPGNGPGRWPGHGNFHLNEFRVLINGTPHQLEGIVVSFSDPSTKEQYRNIIDGTIDGNHWGIYPQSGQPHFAMFATDLELGPDDELTLELISSRGRFPQHNLGRFRLSVSADPEAYTNDAKRFAVLRLTDPWTKLAAAYHLIGDQTALDALQKQHATAASAIAELHVAAGDWPQAIQAYSKLIDDQTADVTLFSRRAAAYIATEQWQSAKVDWLRVIELQPDQTQRAFDEFKMANRWNEAAEFGLKLIEQKPDAKSWQWVAVAPVITLSGDPTAYADFCRRMLLRYGESQDIEDAERMVKVSLLLPGVITPDQLPIDRFTRSLDDGTAPTGFLPWGWGTRALIAWRSGDADSVLKYAARSEESKPNDVSHAFNLALIAAAQHQLQHPDEAQAALEEASQLLTRLKADPGQRVHHDLLIAEILFHEAKVVCHGGESK